MAAAEDVTVGMKAAQLWYEVKPIESKVVVNSRVSERTLEWHGHGFEVKRQWEAENLADVMTYGIDARIALNECDHIIHMAHTLHFNNPVKWEQYVYDNFQKRIADITLDDVVRLKDIYFKYYGWLNTNETKELMVLFPSLISELKIIVQSYFEKQSLIYLMCSLNEELNQRIPDLSVSSWVSMPEEILLSNDSVDRHNVVAEVYEKIELYFALRRLDNFEYHFEVLLQPLFVLKWVHDMVDKMLASYDDLVEGLIPSYEAKLHLDFLLKLYPELSSDDDFKKQYSMIIEIAEKYSPSHFENYFEIAQHMFSKSNLNMILQNPFDDSFFMNNLELRLLVDRLSLEEDID